MLTILWRRLDQEGHEAARLDAIRAGWLLSGSAVFVHEQQPCRLNYNISCDQGWSTHQATVSGWVGDALIDIRVAVEAGQRWYINATEIPAVAGCSDIDLNFSPVTNLLPIRRLGLREGQRASVRAAWLRFPSFALEPLDQEYQRLDATTVRYISGGGSFVALLTLREDGFVTHYQDLWEIVTGEK